ncbi:40S ribosomal protein S21-2 isoform X2 [Morus notabilis]|uniref:40S ribosomal protein S21-2 isoform X2 n=1 Tax=Morus notabilis TaxID=981085 RepID=UPI000CED09E7|nr:40S ribosomal protein S21-2 isoform X2 [Morus notabilis]
MQNEEGVITELYIPRKCSATNRLITSKDHASVQINAGHLDENGIYTGQFSTFALCGFVRAQNPLSSTLSSTRISPHLLCENFFCVPLLSSPFEARFPGSIHRPLSPFAG